MKRRIPDFKEREQKFDFFSLSDFEKFYVFIRDNKSYSKELRSKLKEMIYNDWNLEAVEMAHNLAMHEYNAIKDQYENKKMPPEVLQKFYERRTIALFLHMAREKLYCEERELKYKNVHIFIK